MEINQLLEGSNNYKSVQADAARLSSKWEQSGLLEGYSNEIEKNNMAMILRIKLNKLYLSNQIQEQELLSQQVEVNSGQE